MQDTVQEALAPRLFGYATLFRARRETSGICPVSAAAEEEALALASALARHLGMPDPVRSGNYPASTPDEWGVSVPFGRCGVDGRPEEHVRVLGASEAWCDRLGEDGTASIVQVEEGQTLTFLPGGVQRLRARPREGGRVLIAFQTEDRTPLLGHAAAWVDEGERVPDEAEARVLLTHRAFDELAQAGEKAIRDRVGRFMTSMAESLSGDPEVERAHTEARQSGSYAAGAAEDLFDRQAALVTGEVLAGIAAAAEGCFRYPGMFGAVAPLFDLL